jgi:hypothetical protein
MMSGAFADGKSGPSGKLPVGLQMDLQLGLQVGLPEA